MGKSSSAGTQPEARRRTIRFTFTATVAIPAICLILLWALAAGAVLGSSLGGHGLWSPDHREVVELTILVGAGLLIGLVCVILMGRFSYKLSQDIAVLATTAQRSADEQLPQLLERLRSGQTPAAPDVTPSRSQPKNAEIVRALAAVGSLEQTAVGAAAGEAGLRDGLRQVFVSLARRNQSLLQRQLRLIDALEQKAPDSAALADLFALDHLTTRMRRHAESLAILSGAAPGRSWTEPVPIIDVIRAAMAEVEDYRRVTVLTTSEDAVAAPAVADMIHLLAELIENATMFSPSGTRVEVRAERVANGFAVEIDDRGLGIEPAQLAEINRQLAQPPDFDLANADRLGLFVGAKLAARHGVRVSLRQSPYGGTTAIVLMPNSIVVLVSASAAPGTSSLPAARRATGRPAALDLGSGAALALTGRRGLPPSLGATDQPGTGPQPTAGAQATGTAQPPTTAQPGNTPQPATTAPPTGTAQPATTAPAASNGAATVTGRLVTGGPAAGSPPAGPPPGSPPAAGPGPDDRAAGAIRRGRRILANPYSVTILGGVVVAVVTVWLTAHASSPGAGQAAAGPPASQPTSPSPGPARSSSQPVPGLQSSGASCQGIPQAGPEHVSAHPPLAVLSADPMGVLGTSYALPGQHVLSPAALSRLNKSQASGGPGSGAYLVSIGGYAVGTNGTQVVVRNTSGHKISILGIRAVRESCQAPLTGTVFANSSSGADLSVNLGFDLDSPDSEARAATGDAVTATSPDYFDKYTVSIRPGRQQVFNLIAVTARHAWSVRYLVTMLVGGTKTYQLLADGTQPFRVTAGLPSGRFYSVAYAGGVASPDQSGDFERINPRYLNQR